MAWRRALGRLGVLGFATLVLAVTAAADEGKLTLSADQTDFLRLEPVLLTLKLEGADAKGLPEAPGGESRSDALRFEVEPPLKPRAGAKPLPGEAKRSEAGTRTYDLLEWFQFPENGGTWTVRAVFADGGRQLASKPLTLTVRTPGKDDADYPAMARIHHIPWSNYETNAYCGDMADVVKKWPESRYARYCHYWNGRYDQGKKEYAKAIESFRTVLDRYPGFGLTTDARRGLEECLAAQGGAKANP